MKLLKISKFRRIFTSILDFFRKKTYYFISEQSQWSIKSDGDQLISYLKDHGYLCCIRFDALFISNSIIHYGSINVFYDKFKYQVFKNNKVFVTIFHGDIDDPVFLRKLNYVLVNLKYISKVIVSNSIMYDKLNAYGIDSCFLKLIPIPIDIKKFPVGKNSTRNNRFIIGSFQKDGEGWGDGILPKYVKGPDLMCEVFIRLKKYIDFEVLLVGPARGYVKKVLEENSINFEHKYFNSEFDVLKEYRNLDLYVIMSREEGGPKGLLEAAAAGIPVITFDVGMARDLFKGLDNVVSCYDLDEFVSKILDVYYGNAYKFVKIYPKILSKYSWDSVGKMYLNLINER